jgi:hypothetical protein
VTSPIPLKASSTAISHDATVESASHLGPDSTAPVKGPECQALVPGEQPLRSQIFAWRFENSVALEAGGAARCVQQAQAIFMFLLLSSFYFVVKHSDHSHLLAGVGAQPFSWESGNSRSR